MLLLPPPMLQSSKNQSKNNYGRVDLGFCTQEKKVAVQK